MIKRLLRLLPQSLVERVFALYSLSLLTFILTGLGAFYYYQFTEAIADSHDSAAVLTEVVQLGNVALRHSARVNRELQNGRPVKILWDELVGKTNDPEADQFLQREYRKAWGL